MKQVMKLPAMRLVLGVLLAFAALDARAAPEAPAGEPAQHGAPPAAAAGGGESAPRAAAASSSAPTPAAAPVSPVAAPQGASPPGAAPASPSAAPAAAGPPPAATSSAKSKLDGGTYTVRLRDLEARVDELKEQIRRSHTRLSLLSDTILSGGVGSAQASILFRNDMSGAFRLTRVLFVLDGAVQYNKQDDSGALSGQKEIPIFKGSIAPGDHTLQVLLGLRGHGFGVFSYLRGYQFEVKQSHSFSISEGKQVELDVIAWEKGGVTTPLEQRPAVRYLERLRDAPPPVGAEAAEAEPAPRKGSGG
jgi:hypothetical protein